MSESLTLKWSVIRGSLYLNTLLSLDDEISVAAIELPSTVTLAQTPADGEIETSDPIFGDTDDGLDMQRYNLLRYRVAAAILELLPGMENLYRANRLNAKADRIENDIQEAFENIYGSNTKTAGHGVKGDDIYG